MPQKYDQDATPGIKLLRIFRKLLLNGQKHFQTDLADEYNCSSQTIIRIMTEIEAVIGTQLEMGFENKKKWYRIISRNPRKLGMDCEELRYLSVCRDLAAQTLPDQILARVDDTIFNISLQMTGSTVHASSIAASTPISFFTKGRINYSGHYEIIEQLLTAISGNKICLISYKALGKDNSRVHRFIAHKLMGLNQTLYLMGATLRQEEDEIKHFVSLAVHRIESVEITDRVLRVDFPEIANESFGLPWHEPRLFKIHFKEGRAARYVEERIWSHDQFIERLQDGSIILHMTSSSEPEVLAWVRSFGEAARLLPQQALEVSLC